MGPVGCLQELFLSNLALCKFVCFCPERCYRSLVCVSNTSPLFNDNKTDRQTNKKTIMKKGTRKMMRREKKTVFEETEREKKKRTRNKNSNQTGRRRRKTPTTQPNPHPPHTPLHTKNPPKIKKLNQKQTEKKQTPSEFDQISECSPQTEQRASEMQQ